MSSKDQEADRIFALIWSDGIPERERIVFEGLPPDKREQVLRRIEAAWKAENGEPWEPLARGIGLGRAAFYNLRKAWRENSLEGAIPYERRPPRSVETSSDSPIRRLARELLLSGELFGGNTAIARRLLAEAGDDPAVGGKSEQTRIQWAERLVRHERRKLALDPGFLDANFARRIVLDLSAVSVVLKGDDELAVVAIVLDAASGLVLGSCLGRIHTAVELERAAADEAFRFVRAQGLDRSLASGERCELDLMLPPDVGPTEPSDWLKEATRSLTLRPPGTYAFGQEVVQLVGPRMGRIPLAPRKTLSVTRTAFARSRKVTELAPAEANAYWEREVLRHNEPIMVALRSAGLSGSVQPEGKVETLLMALDDFLLSLPPPDSRQ